MRSRARLWMLFPVLMVPLLMLSMEKGDASKGKAVFSRCSICHGASGEGNEAIAKALGAQIPVLSSKEVQLLDDAVLKKIVIEGKGKMKPVGLSDAEAADVIAFFRTLKKPAAK
jgi:cytochrome c